MISINKDNDRKPVSVWVAAGETDADVPAPDSAGPSALSLPASPASSDHESKASSASTRSGSRNRSSASNKCACCCAPPNVKWNGGRFARRNKRPNNAYSNDSHASCASHISAPVQYWQTPTPVSCGGTGISTSIAAGEPALGFQHQYPVALGTDRLFQGSCHCGYKIQLQQHHHHQRHRQHQPWQHQHPPGLPHSPHPFNNSYDSNNSNDYHHHRVQAHGHNPPHGAGAPFMSVELCTLQKAGGEHTLREPIRAPLADDPRNARRDAFVGRTPNARHHGLLVDTRLASDPVRSEQPQAAAAAANAVAAQPAQPVEPAAAAAVEWPVTFHPGRCFWAHPAFSCGGGYCGATTPTAPSGLPPSHNLVVDGTTDFERERQRRAAEAADAAGAGNASEAP